MVGGREGTVTARRHRQNTLIVALSAGCLALLSWSFLSFTSRRDWGELSDVPWHAGPPEWVAISILIVLLFLHERAAIRRHEFPNSFSAMFLVWVAANVVFGVAGAFIQYHAQVPEWFDEAVLFGTVTFGLTQLGMAAIFREHLRIRFLGQIGWLLGIVYGVVAAVISIVMSLMLST